MAPRGLRLRAAVRLMNGTNNGTLTDEQADIILGLQFATSSLAILGALWVMGWLIKLGSIRQLSSRILFSLALCCFFVPFTLLLTPIHWSQRHSEIRSGFCTFQGVMLTFWGLSTFFWTTIGAINVCAIVLWHKSPAKWEIFYNLSWVVAFILALVPLGGSNYYKTESDYWCWIGPSLVHKFLCFWVPLDICILITVIAYTIITIKMKRFTEPQSKNESEYQRAIRTMRFFPYPFVFLWFFPMVNRYHSIATGTQSFGLYVLQVLSDPILGFVLAWIYTTNGRAWRRIQKVLGITPSESSDPNGYNIQNDDSNSESLTEKEVPTRKTEKP